MTYFPEELLNEILAYALLLYPIDVFMVPYYLQRFAQPLYKRRAKRAKEALLVCKRWRRIGTPYLYRTVEITSVVELQGLKTTLTSSPHLRPMIHNLRIDPLAAYGHDLATVAKLLEHVRVLHVQLATLPRYSPQDLARYLECFNPTTLYLHGLGWRNCIISAGRSTQGFFRAVRGWTALTQITLIHDSSQPPSVSSELMLKLGGIPQFLISGNQSVIAGLIQSREFYSAVRKAGSKAIICHGVRGCLDEFIKKHEAVIPSEILELLVYEEPDWYKFVQFPRIPS